jgi:hypothetical protein
VPEGEGRADRLVAIVQRADDGLDEGGLARAELSGQRDDIAGVERGGQFRGHALEGGQIFDARVFDFHDFLSRFRSERWAGGEESCGRGAKRVAMWLRANDVLVGVITGAVSAVVAALFELFFVAERFLSVGRHGGAFGSKLLVVAIVGAIVGGVVGFFVGAVIKPRPQAR